MNSVKITGRVKSVWEAQSGKMAVVSVEMKKDRKKQEGELPCDYCELTIIYPNQLEYFRKYLNVIGKPIEAECFVANGKPIEKEINGGPYKFYPKNVIFVERINATPRDKSEAPAAQPAQAPASAAKAGAKQEEYPPEDMGGPFAETYGAPFDEDDDAY